MGDLVVKPSYQLGPKDILTVDKINLMATPVVELALADPVNDQNFFRNGNFYSSFWATPAGITCPADADTANADYWVATPRGDVVTYLRSSIVPDIYSLFSAELDGGTATTSCEFGQSIIADLAATLRRKCTFSGYIQNLTGLTLSPFLNIYTCNTFNNFNDTTLQETVNLPTIQNGEWGYATATIDLTAVPNVANGLFISVQLPAGTLNGTAKLVRFSRLKFQIGEIATQFVDDTSLFVTVPTIDASMLQDGCIARPALFQPSVIPAGAYMPQSIQTGDIGVGQVQAANLDPGINTTTSAGFTVPAVKANVAISVTSATRISPGLILTVQGAGNYLVMSVVGNVVTAQNRGDAGNASPGAIVNSGASVTTNGNAVIGSLGYTPVNKGGDTAVGALQHTIDTVVGAGSGAAAAVVVQSTDPNKANDGYFPAIGLVRDPAAGPARSIGLTVDNRLKTVDATGKVGYIGDSITQLDTSFYQDKSITLAKLADDLVNLIIPPGIMEFFAGPTPPTGWIVADGTAVSRTTYANLFAAIGTYWGAGDNISTFNVPDMRGRVPIGYVNASVAGITARAFGSRGGEENHVLSVAELANHAHGVNDPLHTHPVNDPQHSHTVVAPRAFGSGSAVMAGGTPYHQNVEQSAAAPTGIYLSSAATGVSIQSNGSNVGHNIMQPFAVGYWIVKT